MRPKNLKFPFSWEERRPHLEDGVLYVPQFYDQHAAWEGVFFSPKQPICIEFCSGNGHWILEMAKRHPDKLWVAVEKKFERVRKIWSKRKNEGVDNLLIVCGQAEPFVEHYIPKAKIKEIYVNFPDPWPKERHAKHRIIKPSFATNLAQVLEPGGKAIFTTDDRPYCDEMVAVMQANPYFTSAFPEPFFSLKWEGYGTSWFETLWKTLGRDIHYLHFERE